MNACKCYRGNKPLGPGVGSPFLIIAAEKERGYARSEHYILTELKKPSLLQRKATWTADATVTSKEFDTIISLETILASELDMAKANLESSLARLDNARYQRMYWQGQNFDFIEVGCEHLAQLAMDPRHKDIVAKILDHTKNPAFDSLRKTWAVVLRLNVSIE